MGDWCGGSPSARPRQDDPEFSELPRLRLHFNRAAVLFHDDVVAHGQAKPGTFARGLGRKERVEYFFFYFGRDAGAVIADANFELVTEILRRGAQHRFEVVTGFHRAFSRCVESV
jgi:hypothetical protein